MNMPHFSAVDLDDLASDLQKREDLIADREFYNRDPDGHLSALMEVSQTLEAWEAEHGSSIDPVLQHYLERRSYSKALAFCRGDTRHRV